MYTSGNLFEMLQAIDLGLLSSCIYKSARLSLTNFIIHMQFKDLTMLLALHCFNC